MTDDEWEALEADWEASARLSQLRAMVMAFANEYVRLASQALLDAERATDDMLVARARAEQALEDHETAIALAERAARLLAMGR